MTRKPLIDSLGDFESAIDNNHGIYKDANIGGVPDHLIRSICVIGAPVQDRGLLPQDHLTILCAVEELAIAGLKFDRDVKWSFYDLLNDEYKVTEGERGPYRDKARAHVRKNFLTKDPGERADLVIVAALKPEEFITTEEYGRAETAERFSFAVGNLSMISRFVQAITDTGAGIVAARDSGVSARDLADERIFSLFAQPGPRIAYGNTLPRDFSLGFAMKPEVIQGYKDLETALDKQLLRRESILLQRLSL